ncbi:hypothetical protein IHQ71_03570 [Rhizobium sp. TH2]|uniref:hypothetical protein n=1 Tax=Rhizobium sp. TH2 TaxID=2775403 RepID=UPI002157ECC8|nr:hypothetical protein [Rhizobium sp. TH2]UVC09709.1 hypothetical protein IHQ71_03570 [Rhizobium sp. TH2]
MMSKRALGLSGALFAFMALTSNALAASPLKGKSYMLEMASTQSGLTEFYVPPMGEALDAAGLTPKSGLGPGADVIVNLVHTYDVGKWVKTASGREWLYTIRFTAGISPEAYFIPHDGTPQFGVEAALVTPNPDREDEWRCLIKLAVSEAAARYQETGLIRISGQKCLRAP